MFLIFLCFKIQEFYINEGDIIFKVVDNRIVIVLVNCDWSYLDR